MFHSGDMSSVAFLLCFDLRPPPGRRTRPAPAERFASISAMPRLIVLRAMPVTLDTQRHPATAPAPAPRPPPGAAEPARRARGRLEALPIFQSRGVAHAASTRCDFLP